MPELPEVEVVKKTLEKKILNLVIKKVVINTKKLRYFLNKKAFQKISNKKILSIKRRSKYLLINLEKKITILVHLGMTGKFFVLENGIKNKTSFYYNFEDSDKKHNHIIFFFNKKVKLIYNDIRKFGFFKILQTKELPYCSHFKLLGPEPLSKNFNLEYCNKNKLLKSKNIKSILMDQKFVSGLGNIYVNEILFLSKINPKKSIKKIKIREFSKIIYFTKKVLSNSIKLGGSSIKNFNDSRGKLGKFQQKFKVYGRDKKKCHRNGCRDFISKINISNRSTFYCKSCQK